MEPNTLEELHKDSTDTVMEKYKILQASLKKKKMLDVNFRYQQLKILKSAVIAYENQIHDANLKDLGQDKFMSFFQTFYTVKNEIDFCVDNLFQWTQKKYVDTPLILAPGRSYVLPEPYGICLIFSAWNSQFLTLLIPLAQAIAAGNLVLAKPSSMAPHSAMVCMKILSELSPDVVQVCLGSSEVHTELLKNRWDIIVFTGSSQKGKIVAKAASEFLTPCILELGGQNPVIVDKSANLENCAYNVISSRCIIAGQACIAPEYVLVDKTIFQRLTDEFKITCEKLYGTNPQHSKDFSRIINEFHTDRLINLIKNPGTGATILSGGVYDFHEKYVSPTIISFDSIDNMSQSELAKEEIFGPILYLAPYDTIDDCVEYINSRGKPLTMYYFGTDKHIKDCLLLQTSSGAFCTNDCIVQFGNPSLPFGGVGSSGYGAYHGKWGFDNLSHNKAVLEKREALIKLRYPPYTEFKQKAVRYVFDKVRCSQYTFLKWIFYGLLFQLVFWNRNLILKRLGY